MAIYLIDIFRVILFCVKHFVGKYSEHEVFLFGVTPDRKGTFDVGRISERIEIDVLHGQRRDRNW